MINFRLVSLSIWLSIWIASIFSSPCAFTADSVQIHIELDPVGSFVARAPSVEGFAVRSGESFIAKDVILKLDSLKTGIGLRDTHLRERFFETQKFPTAVLTEGTAKDGKFAGKLKIRGITHPIFGTYQVEGKTLVGIFPAKLSDFKIQEAKYMGVEVVDEVKVEVILPVQENPSKKKGAETDS